MLRAARRNALAVLLSALPGVAAAAPAADSDVADGAAVAAADEGPEVEKKDEKKKEKHEKKRESGIGMQLGGWDLSAETTAAASGGALQGVHSLHVTAALLELEAKARGEMQRGPWRLRAPISVAHRETPGASLAETRGRLGAEVRYRHSPKLRLSGGGKIAAYYRPDWPDLYQPLGNGDYEGTDRYSHWDRTLSLDVAGIPLRHQHASVGYEYTVYDYAEDPNFDPNAEPTHLVPGDRSKHSLDLSWVYFGHRFKVGGGAELFVESYDFAFSRDAGTGLTHAGAGGPPPNPLQKMRGVEPQVSAELEIGKAVELDVGYGFEVVEDTYQGYYSYTGHHPEATLSWKPSRVLEIEGKGEIYWRRYGSNSYAMGPGHPALTYGDRRVDHRGKAGVEVRRALSAHWSVVGEGDLLIRRTNFPSYVPGVFPAGRDYDIDWNYDNWTVVAGVEHHL